MDDATNAGPATGERPRRGRPGATDASIHDAVLQLLVDDGYEAMTLDGVARRAGASKATLYRRWGGKQGLVLAALAGFKDDDSTSADTGGLRDDLIALARSVNDASDRTGGLLGALAHAVQHDVELAAAVESELGSPLRTRFSQLLARAVARGELAESILDDSLAPDVLPLMLMGRRLLTGRFYTDAEAVAIIDQILLPTLQRPT